MSLLRKRIFVLTAASLMAAGFSSCSDDSTGSYSSNTPCVEGTKSCDGNILKTCLADGSYDTDDCTSHEQICDPEKLECADKGEQTGCTPGTKSCDGNTLKTCKDDGSYDTDDCTTHGQICDSQKLECVDENQQTGCTPGTKSCDGTFLKICKEDGSDYDKTDCAESYQICDPTELKCVEEQTTVCTPNAKSCNGNILIICNGEGSDYEEVNCETSDQICDPTSLACLACIPGSKICSDTDVLKTCKDDGSAYEETQDCTLTSQICDDEDFNCRDNTFCKPNKKFCDLDVLKTCAPDGSEYNEVDCTAQGLICDDETLSCIEENHEESCTGTELYCDNKNVFHHCNSETHLMETIKCTETQTCNDLLGCIDSGPTECTETMNTCIDGNTKLSKCNMETHEMETIDCAADDGKVCNPNTVSCEYECYDNDVDCFNTTTRMVCNNHKYDIVECGTETPWCVLGECVAKTTKAQCIEQGKAYDEATGECHAIDSLIGKPCTCTNNCTITITGKEFKNIFSSKGDSAGLGNSAQTLLEINSAIKDNDNITIPNVFPGAENIQGCGDIVVPDGMSLGCFRDGTITTAKNIVDFIKSIPTKTISIKAYGFITVMSMSLADQFPANIKTALLDVADLLGKGIDFAAPGGYCVVGDIDVGNKMVAYALKKDAPIFGDVTIELINTNPDPLDKTKDNSVVHKLNTGLNTHDVVVQGVQNAAANEVNYCPAGSTIFSYSKTKVMSRTGTVNLDIDLNMAFDLCLQACDTDDDCRKEEGYTCINIRSTSAAEGQDPNNIPRKQACFIQSNLDSLENLF